LSSKFISGTHPESTRLAKVTVT